MNIEPYNAKASRPKQGTRKVALLLLAAMVILGIASSSLLYLQHRKDQRIINDSGAGQAETQALVRRVSHLMVLPSGEKPVVATVSDSQKLSRQAFFSAARNGDKVLIYPNAKTAILYDPERDLILAVSPLNAGSGASHK